MNHDCNLAEQYKELIEKREKNIIKLSLKAKGQIFDIADEISK
jgi:hypothetical protein